MTRRMLSSEGLSSWQVLVDFDGTIAPDDPTDRLLERFADPLWRVIEEQWQSGLISSRQCMQRQVDLLRVSPEALDAAIGTIRIDCRVSAANCKCSHGQRPHLRPRVVVGDGRSDFCMSLQADYVIAKGTLADFCRDSG